MKLWRKNLIICIILSLIMLSGCGLDRKDRIYVQDGNILSDGVVTYKRLPKDWSYIGEYPVKIGKVKGGNALYGSDDRGTIVQERKSWYADMEYAPFVLSSVEIPEVPTQDYDVYVVIFLKSGAHLLSETASEDFAQWYQANQSKKSSESEVTHNQPFAYAYITLRSIPGLRYNNFYYLVQGENVIYVTNDNGRILHRQYSNSAFYTEVLRLAQ